MRKYGSPWERSSTRQFPLHAQHALMACVIIGSGNGLSPVRRQAITWACDCLLSIVYTAANQSIQTKWNGGSTFTISYEDSWYGVRQTMFDRYLNFWSVSSWPMERDTQHSCTTLVGGRSDKSSNQSLTQICLCIFWCHQCPIYHVYNWMTYSPYHKQYWTLYQLCPYLQ